MRSAPEPGEVLTQPAKQRGPRRISFLVIVMALLSTVVGVAYDLTFSPPPSTTCTAVEYALITRDGDGFQLVENNQVSQGDINNLVGRLCFTEHRATRSGLLLPTFYILQRRLSISFLPEIKPEERAQEIWRSQFIDHLRTTTPYRPDKWSRLAGPDVDKVQYLWPCALVNGAILLGVPSAAMFCLAWAWLHASPTHRRRRKLKSGRCPNCRYELHGLTVCRCPECGDRWTPEELPVWLRPAETK